MPNVSPYGIYTRRSGSWVPATDVDVKRSGAWSQAKSVHALRAGVWTKVWEDNAAPNPVTALTLGTPTWGGSNYSITATWSNPADGDLSQAEVTWTVNGVAQTPATQSAATTSASRTIAANDTVSVAVRLKDTGNLWSTVVTSSTVTAPPGAITGASGAAMSLDVVALTFTAPTGATSIDVARSVNGGASSTVTLATSGSGWEDTIGTSSTVTYTLRAVSAAGYGPSTVVSTSTQLGAPSSLVMAAGYATNWTTASFSWVRTGTGSGTTLPASCFYRIIRGGASLSTTTGLSGSFSISSLWDTNFTLAVRLESTYKGRTVTGGTSNTLNLSIGHNAYTTTQAWSGTNSSVNLYGNSSGTGSLTGAGGVTVPSNVAISSMTVSLSCTFSTSVFCNYNQRDAYIVQGGAVGSKLGTKSNPWSESGVAVSGGAGLCGILLVGSGWSWTSTGGFRATGTITVYGTQTVNVAAENNGYF